MEDDASNRRQNRHKVYSWKCTSYNGGGFNGVAEVKNTTNEIEISLLPLRKKNQKLIKSNIFSVFSNEFDTIYGNRLQKIVFNVFNEFKLIESA